MTGWRTIESAPEGVEVVTAVCGDGLGVHNEQNLVRKGRLWFVPDGSMYVYYEPTHWHPIDAGLSTPEPSPITNGNRPVWDLVIEDMRTRDNEGRRKYGTPLQAGNGRDSLVDAYQEELDKVVYLRQAIEEQRLDAQQIARLREKVAPGRWLPANLEAAVDEAIDRMQQLEARVAELETDRDAAHDQARRLWQVAGGADLEALQPNIRTAVDKAVERIRELENEVAILRGTLECVAPPEDEDG